MALPSRLSIRAHRPYVLGVHPYFDRAGPLLFGHRGASGELPENTLPAFARAWEQGVRYLEMDCHATRDGQIVVFHDATLERTTDGRGRLSALSYAEVKQLDAGYRFSPDGTSFPERGRGFRVPLLADVLREFPDARINLEVKQADPPIAGAVLEVIRRAKAEERVLLAADEPAILASIRALRPATALGSSRADVLEFYLALRDGALEAHRPLGHALQVPPSFLGQSLVTPESIAAAETLGLHMHVWTINDEDEMRALLHAGVHGVMSDFPGRLVRVASELEAER
jgi:glycerophosphoryl diester phosphodiesterase